MEEGWGSGGGPGYRPSAPSQLMQIVPNSASRYTVFHSVIFNSVEMTNFSKKNKIRDIQNCRLRLKISLHSRGGVGRGDEEKTDYF